jgi:4-hydroxybenzoate polyprenyltransferase
MLGFAANVLGDIRGCEGDKFIGMLTLPILLGSGKTKWIIYSIISLILISILYLKYIAFYPLIPFMIFSLVLLSRDYMKWVRVSMLSSFAFLPVFLILANIIGGG